MNVGEMLVGLGFEAEPARAGFPCPHVIRSREPVPIGPSHMLETQDHIDAAVDMRKTVGERATGKRSPGN
jgi:hypothetical protein